MKIGLMIVTAGAPDLESVLAQIDRAEAMGFASAWVSSVRSFDALTVLALAGQRTRRIELGTFVTPTYPRHPAALAEQALAVQAASGGGPGARDGRSPPGTVGQPPRPDRWPP